MEYTIKGILFLVKRIFIPEKDECSGYYQDLYPKGITVLCPYLDSTLCSIVTARARAVCRVGSHLFGDPSLHDFLETRDSIGCFLDTILLSS